MEEFLLLKKLKFEKILDIIQNERKDSEIIIIFCRFIDVLENLQNFLESNKIHSKKIDGSVSWRDREKKLKPYMEHPETCYKRVLLCSLKTCSLGLNFSFASKLIIMDPFWNKSTSEQVYSRICRINQLKKCTIYWMVMQETIDSEMVSISDSKEKRKLDYIEKYKLKHVIQKIE